jgi:hypothetical protein
VSEAGEARGWLFGGSDPEGWIAKVTMSLTVCSHQGAIAWAVPEAFVTTTAGVTGNL